MGINRIGKTLHQTTLELGKVDGYSNGRRSCAATITIELRERVENRFYLMYNSYK